MARTVRSHDRLRILVDLPEVGEVRAGDGRIRAVQGEPAPLAVPRVTVKIAAIQRQMMGNRRSVDWLEPVLPNSTRLALLVAELGRNSRNCSRQ